MKSIKMEQSNKDSEKQKLEEEVYQIRRALQSYLGNLRYKHFNAEMCPFEVNWIDSIKIRIDNVC